MKTLEKEFSKTMAPMGYKVRYEQLQREGNVAIYKRTAPEWVDYEVIRIRQSKAGEMKVKDDDGKETTVKFEAAEHYPTSNAWGTDGFTFKTEDGARIKACHLAAEEEEKAAAKA